MKCVSLNNQARLTIVNKNSDEFLLCIYCQDNKRGGSCNTTDDPYAQICVRNKFKNMNIKLFHLISEVNVTRFLVQHE